jgi:hypothetical protein
MKNHKIYPAMLLVAGLVATPVSAQGPPRFDLAAGRIFGGVTGVMAQIGICQRFALAKGEGGKEEAMSWMEVAIEYRKSVSGAIRRAQTFLPQEIQKNVIANGQKLIDWNTKNSSTAKLSNTCRRLGRDFIAQIGVARPLSEQFPKEMLLYRGVTEENGQAGKSCDLMRSTTLAAN